jgi:hypothetical protein
VVKFKDSALPELWYRSKTAYTKSGVSVPLMFRIATTADCKDPLKRHRQRRLWKMPLREALEVAKQQAEAGGPEEDAGGAAGAVDAAEHMQGAGGRKGRVRGKRARIDGDGDVVMVRPCRHNPHGTSRTACARATITVCPCRHNPHGMRQCCAAAGSRRRFCWGTHNEHHGRSQGWLPLRSERHLRARMHHGRTRTHARAPHNRAHACECRTALTHACSSGLQDSG